MKNHDLIWARDFAGLTQSKIAEIFGVSRRTVINWEQGHTKLPPAKFKYLLGVLDIDPKLVPQNTQPEPVPAPTVNPAPKEAAPVTAPKRRSMGTWASLFRDGKDAFRRVLEAAVRASDIQETFEVRDLVIAFMRVGAPADDTPMVDAWVFILDRVNLAQAKGFLKAEKWHKPVSQVSTWSLTQAGWEAFEKNYKEKCRDRSEWEDCAVYTDEFDGWEEPLPFAVYPSAYNRLFGDLV